MSRTPPKTPRNAGRLIAGPAFGVWAVAAALGCAPGHGAGGGAIAAQAPAPPTAVAAAPAAPATPVRREGPVVGRVMTPAGSGFRPVAGVRVAAGGATTLTDAEGRYFLPRVPAGEQVVRLAHPAFRDAGHPVVVSPGVGTPRANVVLEPRGYGLRQAAGFAAEISGVVYDPRGAALPAATVTLACDRALGGRGISQAATSDADGFFIATLPNVVPLVAPPEVVATASGTTPGGVPVRSLAPLTATLDQPRLALNVQALGFPDPGTPAVVGSAFIAGGETAAIALGALSASPDEFHVEIACGGQVYDALPLSVGAGEATFRVPEGMADRIFTARVVPFGRVAARTAPSPDFVTAYDEADLERDIGFDGAATIVDISEATGSINAPRFMAGEVARFALALTNANERIAPVVDLFGSMPPGSVGVAAAIDGVTVPLDGPDAFGAFRIAGVRLPKAGRAVVEAEFRSPLSAGNAFAFAPTGLGVQMPAIGLSKPTGPASPDALAVAGVDTTGFTFAKAVVDDGTPGNGKARVVLRLQPGASLAGAAYKVTDATKTEVASTATAAVFAGTIDLPAAGTALGLTTADVLDLKIDGATAPQVKIFGATYDAETLIGQINNTDGLAGKVRASRTAGKFQLERVDQGAGKTLEVVASAGSARMRGVLGLPTGVKKGGFQADFTAATARQDNGTVWTLISSAVSWNAAAGQTAATIVVRPPATFAPGDSPSTPITITYDVIKLNGAAGNFGGGTGATLGPKAVSYNLVAPYTISTNDRNFNASSSDAASVGGL